MRTLPWLRRPPSQPLNQAGTYLQSGIVDSLPAHGALCSPRLSSLLWARLLRMRWWTTCVTSSESSGAGRKPTRGNWRLFTDSMRKFDRHAAAGAARDWDYGASPVAKAVIATLAQQLCSRLAGYQTSTAAVWLMQPPDGIIPSVGHVVCLQQWPARPAAPEGEATPTQLRLLGCSAQAGSVAKLTGGRFEHAADGGL